MLSKNEIKILEKEYGFRPQKKLGQNFLIDANIKRKIISAAALKGSDTVLEIGPGLGELTLDLAEAAFNVIAVEFDKKLFSILREQAKDLKNIKVVHSDFLKYDLREILPPAKKVKVVSNLPYYVSTPIILKLLDNKDLIESALLTLQKEVADRLTAAPRTKEYGSLTIFTAFNAKVEKLFNIKKNSFYPVPRINSTVIFLKPRRTPPVKVGDEKLFLGLVKAAFSLRRKTLTNSLSQAGFSNLSKSAIQSILQKAGISENARAEELSLADFARIANLI